MEEDEIEDSTPSPKTPFWLQSSTNHRRLLSSFFLNSGFLISLLCVTAIVFIFFIIPSIVSLTSQIFTPTNAVKKSWDSVNLVLVLVALVFGFLSRNRPHDYGENHRNVSSEVIRGEIQKSSNPSTPRQQWYEYSDRTVFSSSSAVNGGGLRRNSCSYPDLRDASPWVKADDRWRFSDDIQVEAHRYSDSDRIRRRRSWKRFDEEEEEQVAPLARANEDSHTPPPSSLRPPTSHPVPPSTDLHQKPKRTYQSIAHQEQVKGSEPTKTTLTPQPVTPTPPPPSIDSENRSSKSDRKRSGSNVTKDLFTSIYNQKNKKKKRRQKSVENFETLIQPQPQPPSPPPPPTLPPPPSVLHNLFSSKKGKSKKIITVPPPSTTARASKSTALILPLKTSNSQRALENSNGGGVSPLTGGESPLIPIPPPPPPPPFKMPSWRFVVKGDYVQVGSVNSSRSGSPDDSPTSTPTATDGGEAVAQLFCSSPDVDAKADMFIAKFRAGLKLQKMNSMKKQGLGLSNLGPDTKPGPGPSQI